MTRLSIFAICSSLLLLGTSLAEEQPNKNKGGQKPPQKQMNVHKQGGVHNPGAHPNPNAQLHKNQMHTNTNVHNTNVGTGNKIHTKTVNNTQINKTNVNNKVVNNYQLKHPGFHAQLNTNIQSAKFNQHYKIAGAQNWHGHQYSVFVNYHPAWHDHGWYHDHYHNVILIGGGWYFWNAGYWYPAWGYDPGVAYYPYDGPIYVGSNPTPPDQVIADVQAALQEQGYYHGDVDGLLGPQTRAALADYQQAQGLELTGAMDEPTLSSLGMA